jgi:ABC-type transport system involved in multi-copper enzyme maturation permease subunit
MILFCFLSSSSKMTGASIWLAVCVMLTEILVTLICFAVFFASPANAIVGRPPA